MKSIRSLTGYRLYQRKSPHAYAVGWSDADFAKDCMLTEKHQYSNTIGRDLWDALDQASGRDHRSLRMDS